MIHALNTFCRIFVPLVDDAAGEKMLVSDLHGLTKMKEGKRSPGLEGK